MSQAINRFILFDCWSTESAWKRRYKPSPYPQQGVEEFRRFGFSVVICVSSYLVAKISAKSNVTLATNLGREES